MINRLPLDLSFYRYLADSQSVDGKANVISAFPYEDDKYRALNVLQTVCVFNIIIKTSYVGEMILVNKV